VAITLRGVFLSMKYEIPAMLETGGGVIVNMSSTAGLEGVGGLAGYVSSKHGVVGLTKVAALDYAERGVRVNALAPGPTLADAAMSAERFERLSRAAPLGRAPGLDELCRALRLILEAPAMTGQMIALDGGRHLGWLLPGEVEARS
jgi:NAD(P)-dependent dehydrogenase (short-subunit alcohol dehydrogenase family)